MSVKGTPNYVWFTAEKLGRGAMGNVYVARSRKKGTKFAAKVFTADMKTMPKDYITIELEILQYLPRHDNVIKFIAVEEETYSKAKVLIMELCESGSLQNILDNPQNHYGLNEEDLLLVLQHITAALEHLYRYNVVHRDVKPGNILLQITPDGRHVYKLIDFGAGRRIDQKDKGFKSLCGTEEYLHPKMHHAAFIKRVPGQVYDHTVDLWSFGVTLYHCAAGSLPFSPKAGIRQDKTKMHKLMNDRDPDVISQVERPDGSIERRTTLPDTCSLSSGVQLKVAEYLRCLLNVRQSADPEMFYSDVRLFFQHIKVHVFVMEMRTTITVFVQPHQQLTNLREGIAMQTNIPASDQVLLVPDGPFESCIASGETFKDLVQTTREQPILLTSSGSTMGLAESPKPALPVVPEYESGMDLASDAKFAKTGYGNVWYYLRLIQSTILILLHLGALEVAYRLSLKMICQRVEPYLWKQSETLRQLGRTLSGLKTRLEMAKHRHRPGCQCLRETDENYQRVSATLLQCEQQHQVLETEYNQLSETGIRSHSVKLNPTKPPCVSAARCKERGAKIAEDALPLYKTIRDDKSKELSHNDAEIHKYSRSELKRCCRHIKEIAEHHCLPELQRSFISTSDKIKSMGSKRQKLIRLEQRVEDCEHEHTRLGEDIFKIAEADLPSSCSYDREEPVYDTSYSLDRELETVHDIQLLPEFLSGSSPSQSNVSDKPEDSGISKSSMYSTADAEEPNWPLEDEATAQLLGDMSMLSLKSGPDLEYDRKLNGMDNPAYGPSSSDYVVVSNGMDHVDGYVHPAVSNTEGTAGLVGRSAVVEHVDMTLRKGYAQIDSVERGPTKTKDQLSTRIRVIRKSMTHAEKLLENNSYQLEAISQQLEEL